jgi:AcrR family transcriptional regulator
MNARAHPNTAFSREKWLDTALKTMLEQCRSKFSLESLIQAMPVTKGSFYTHFENRADFLNALVDFWHRNYTKSVIEKYAALPPAMTAEDRLWALTMDIYERGMNRFELLIRSLSLEFAEIRESIRKVDMERLETLEQLFMAMGFERDEAKTRALMYVTLLSQDQNVFIDLNAQEWRSHIKLRHEFLTRP